MHGLSTNMEHAHRGASPLSREAFLIRHRSPKPWPLLQGHGILARVGCQSLKAKG